ncbi:MAG: HlyD family secretion protein [Phycisphaerae bacterium]
MFRRACRGVFAWGIPIVAASMLAFAVFASVRSQQKREHVDPPFAPPTNPYADAVAATGIVEPNTENIGIGVQRPGVVREMFVEVGDAVAKGDKLFQIDDTKERALLAVRQQRLDVATAQWNELRDYPRTEEIPPAQAVIAAASANIVDAEANLADQQRQLRFIEQARQRNAATEDEVEAQQNAVKMAEAQLTASQARFRGAEADLSLLKAGTFAPRIAVAAAQVAQARAEIEEIRADVELLTVRAPIAGKVLQRNIRVGEYAQAGMLSSPLMVLGNVDPLHVRVDVDENDAVRVRAGAPARAYIRGDARFFTDLEFVRFEPLVVPKRSLSGMVGERVDTRVLQVIYRFDPEELPIYVGQQVDVYIREGVAETQQPQPS